MYKILIVDDDMIYAQYLANLLRQPNLYEIKIFDNPQAALKMAHDVNFDVVISDLRMPEIDGIDFLTDFRYSLTVKNFIKKGDVQNGTRKKDVDVSFEHRFMLDRNRSRTGSKAVPHAGRISKADWEGNY